jgi:hypothetical protein
VSRDAWQLTCGEECGCLRKPEVSADVPGLTAALRLSCLPREEISMISGAGVASCSVSTIESLADEARCLALELDGTDIFVVTVNVVCFVMDWLV